MRGSFGGPYGKYCIKQEDTLTSPSFQRTIFLQYDAQIVLYLLIYILSREGGGWTPCGTEKERP